MCCGKRRQSLATVKPKPKPKPKDEKLKKKWYQK